MFLQFLLNLLLILNFFNSTLPNRKDFVVFGPSLYHLVFPPYYLHRSPRASPSFSPYSQIRTCKILHTVSCHEVMLKGFLVQFSVGFVSFRTNFSLIKRFNSHHPR